MKYLILVIILGWGFSAAAQVERNDPKGNVSNEMVNFFNQLELSLDSLREFNPTQSDGIKYRNCLAAMILYIRNYESLELKLANESECQARYNLLGKKSQVLLLATTTMYCPSELYELLSIERKDARRKLESLIEISHLSVEIDELVKDSRKVNFEKPQIPPGIEGLETAIDVMIGAYFGFYSHSGKGAAKELGDPSKDNIIFHYLWVLNTMITQYFHPMTLMAEALEVNQEMKSLPCSDGVIR